jgi:hypothetical protein
MPQFYPDGPAAVSLNAIQEGGGLNTPSQENFDTPALQGTMQQLLSENLGKFVIADFLVGVSTLVRRVGVLYSVGRGFVVLYLDDYKAFEVCDFFSLKFITFFPPGSEPALDEILRGAAGSGILNADGYDKDFNNRPVSQSFSGQSAGGSSMNGGSTSSSMSGNMNNSMNSRSSNSMSGCRTLGQR